MNNCEVTPPRRKTQFPRRRRNRFLHGKDDDGHDGDEDNDDEGNDDDDADDTDEGSENYDVYASVCECLYTREL